MNMKKLICDKKVKNIFYFSLIWCFVFYTSIFAGGLSTPCGTMILGNLKIGQEYSLKQLLGYPYNVSYRGSFPVDLKIDVVKPSTTTPDGFEPVPDINWITLQRSEFALDPGQTAETDIFIKIPNDESLLGRKFRVIISPYTSPPKGDNRAGIVVALGLSCNLYLSIAPKPPTEEEIRQQKKRILSNYVNFSVSPERIFLYDLYPDKVYNLTKEFLEVIKVINATQQDVSVSFEKIKPSEIGIFLPEDTKEITDLTLLKCVPKKFVLKKDSIKSVELILSTKGLGNKSFVKQTDINQTQSSKDNGLTSQQFSLNTSSTSNEPIDNNQLLVQNLPQKYFTVVKVNLSNKYTDINYYVKFYIEIKQ
jgi:hypothetical protein